MAVQPKHEAAVLTEVMLAVFRVNGRLLERGDELVYPLDLTSARWQVLGAVALAERPLTVPQIAEAMGITRQGAQKQVNLLEAGRFFARVPNPRHQRSPLYTLTDLGKRRFANAMTLEAAWANSLATGLSLKQLKNALKTLNAIYERLDSPLPRKGVRP
jgi:DNA-binding MarR family transcriptional regulator